MNTKEGMRPRPHPLFFLMKNPPLENADYAGGD